MAMTRVRPLLLAIAVLATCCAFYVSNLGPLDTSTAGAADAAAEPRTEVDRSPSDVVLSTDEKWAVTANETSNTVSLVDLASGSVAAELPCGAHPAALAVHGEILLVSCSYSGTLERFRWRGG